MHTAGTYVSADRISALLHLCWMEKSSQEIREAKAGISDMEMALQKKGRECVCTTTARLAGTGTCRGSDEGGKGYRSNGIAGRV